MKKRGIIRRSLDALKQFIGMGAKALYKGASLSRLLADWIMQPLSADQEIKGDMLRLRTRARDLARNHPLIKAYIALLLANVIGPKGYKFQAQVRNNNGELNKPINDKIEAGWKRWGRKVSTCGRYSLTEFAKLTLKTVATDGEAFVREVVDFKGNDFRYALQPIDADMVDHQLNRRAVDGENEVRMGVEVDAWGAPVAFFIYDKHPAEDGKPRAQRVPANEIIHLFDPERVNQTRGMSWFNPIMFYARMLDGYVEAELVAARISASKMGFFKFTDDAAHDLEKYKPKDPLNIEANPGSTQVLPPGLEFQDWSPDHPASAFPAFVKNVSRFIASGLRVSYNSLCNDLEGVTYSSMRSGVLIEREQWRSNQEWFAQKFMHRVYESWIETAMLAGALVLDSRDPAKFKEVIFRPRGWQWVDPLKDGQSNKLALDSVLATRQGILGETGEDFEEILEQRAEEDRLMKLHNVKPAATAVEGGGDEGSGAGDEDDDDSEGKGKGDGEAGRGTAAGRKVSVNVGGVDVTIAQAGKGERAPLPVFETEIVHDAKGVPVRLIQRAVQGPKPAPEAPDATIQRQVEVKHG